MDDTGKDVETRTAEEHKKRVMIVDDEQPILTVFTTILERAGYEVDTYLRCDDALARIKQLLAADPANKDPYWRILTDVHMPSGMDGCAFAKAVHKEGITSPVLLITGYGGTITDKNRPENVRALLIKPIGSSTLVGLLENPRDYPY